MTMLLIVHERYIPQKRGGYFNLAVVLSVTAEEHYVNDTLSYYFSYTS